MTNPAEENQKKGSKVYCLNRAFNWQKPENNLESEDSHKLFHWI